TPATIVCAISSEIAFCVTSPCARASVASSPAAIAANRKKRVCVIILRLYAPLRLPVAPQAGRHRNLRPRARPRLAGPARETKGSRRLRLLDLPPRPGPRARAPRRRLRPRLVEARRRPHQPALATVHGPALRADRPGPRRALPHDERS